MQPIEALQRTIDTAIGADDGRSIDPDNPEYILDQEAIAICRSFLDAAIPIARFRCYVTIEGLNPKGRLGLGDYTICGTSIPSIKNGLLALRMEKVHARILLWELQQEKADMISGYQGDTKTIGYRNWLAQIDQYEAERDPPPQIGPGDVGVGRVPRRRGA